jgi:hypothetical protein
MERGVYRHYKGDLYLVLGFGVLEESLEKAVIYQHLEGDFALWIRKQSIFEEVLTLTESNDHRSRFTFVRPWTKDDVTSNPRAFPLLKNGEECI